MSTEHDTARRKPDCVVIDTNIWRSDLLLKTPVGVSLVYTLARQSGIIGLLEVVEKELKKKIVEEGLEAAEVLKNSSRIIDTLTDSASLPSLPTKIELENIVDARIAELAPILIQVPFTLEHAKAALDMVNAKLPPNGPKNQQFKDSAIWQAILTLSQEYSVHFITNDRAFLLDRNDPSKGLAPNLQEDCRRIEGTVAIYCDLGSCLKAIRGDAPSFDRERIASLIMASVMLPLQAEATQKRFQIRDILEIEITAFRTGQPDRLAVDYTITMRFEVDPSMITDDRTDCRAITHGSCYYDQGVDALSGEFIEYIIFEWKSPGGGHGRYTRSLGEEDPSIPFRRPMKWG